MGKVSKHPYHSETVYFGTQHDKATALAPHFAKIGMKLKTAAVNTDAFGTFTGEVERKGSVKETLRKKVGAVLTFQPKARFVLASEGSFGPHPFAGFVQSDYEVLLFFDKLTGVEVFADELSTKTNHDEIEFGPTDELQKFLERANFPSHGIIARPEGDSSKVFKGLIESQKLGQAIIDCFAISNEPKIILSTDMRASYNPTRMSVISQAGEKLLERLRSFCPSCSAIGFGPINSIRGLPCSDCGLPTQATKEIIWGCVYCKLEQTRTREDGLKFESSAKCELCNP